MNLFYRWTAAALLLISLRPGSIQAADEVLPVHGDADFFAAMDLSQPDLADLKQAVDRQDWASARAAWAHHLEVRQTPRWLWSHRDRKSIESIYAQNFGGLQKKVPAADQVLRREFDFLGVAQTLSRDPKWIQGPNEWTNVLSRFEYFKTLGQAYWATGDAKYADDFVYLLEHWIADNPAPPEVAHSWAQFGTVWRTLETGIRSCNWLDDMELFMDAPQFDANAKCLLTRSLVEHARRLYSHETQFRQGNWQVCECTGLTCLGVMLPEFKEAAAWRDRGLKYLVEHMQRDVYPDGTHWEVTPGYHSWVMNEFLTTALVCKLNHIPTPGLLDRHEKMFEYLMHTAKPDGQSPSIGDAGQGVQIAESMGLGALLYHRADMRWLGPEKIAEPWVWIFGPSVVEQYATLPSTPPDQSSHEMPDSHFIMMRTGWNRDDKYLMFNCAPWGGGHGHHDRLEVLAYAGRDLLIDPGMYSYDQPLSHEYFRKAEAHNILMIDGHEPPGVGPQVLAWQHGSSADFAAAELRYDGIRHQRSVLFVRPDYWVVTDRISVDDDPPPQATTHPTKPISTTGHHEFTRLFHFPSGPVRVEASNARTEFADGANISVIDVDNTVPKLREGWIATGLATAEHDQVAAFVNTSTLPVEFCTVLFPLRDSSPPPLVERLVDPNRGLVRLRVKFANGRIDTLAIAPSERPIEVGTRTSTAWAAGTIQITTTQHLIELNH